MKWSCVLLFGLYFLSSCRNDNPYNELAVNDVKVDHWIRYEDLLNRIDSVHPQKELHQLEITYPEFTNIFFLRVINDQYNPDTSFSKIYSMYHKSPVINDIYKNYIPAFKDLSKEEKEYAESFARFSQMVPGYVKPKVFTCLTEFGVGVFSTSDTIMGVSLDMYLGEGNKYYSVEIWPAYIQHNMNRENIVPNLLKNFIRNSVLPQREPETLLDHMIRQGKEVYLLRRMIPPAKDTLVYGYTSKQLDFCKKNEKEMWAYFLSQKLVYEANLKKIQKYVDDAPTSPGMPPDAPGRTSAFIGGQIIEAYMKRHKNVSVQRMLRETNSQKIFEESKYKP